MTEITTNNNEIYAEQFRKPTPEERKLELQEVANMIGEPVKFKGLEDSHYQIFFPEAPLGPQPIEKKMSPDTSFALIPVMRS